MRLILILLIAAIAFGVVQGMRHGCKFAFDRATYDCIMQESRSRRPRRPPKRQLRPQSRLRHQLRRLHRNRLEFSRRS